MYQLTGVTRDYQKGRHTVHALDGVDLVIEDGDWLAIQGPTGHADPARDFRLGRPAGVRLGQVVVRSRIARQPARDGGHRGREVALVQHVQPAPGQVAELADHQPPAGPGDPEQLGEPGVRIGEVPQPERDRDGVERRVTERQRQRVTGHERHRRGRPARSHPEHAEREVAGNAVRAAWREGPRRRSGAGRKIEDPLSRGGPDGPGHHRAPVPVLAQ